MYVYMNNAVFFSFHCSSFTNSADLQYVTSIRSSQITYSSPQRPSRARRRTSRDKQQSK